MKKKQIFMSVRCLNEKGTVVFIPEKLAAMPDYMRRNKLVVDEIKPQEELKPLTEVNLKTTSDAPDSYKWSLFDGLVVPMPRLPAI